MFDESLEEFIPANIGRNSLSIVSERGLPSMVTVISDPIIPSNHMEGRVRSWMRNRFHGETCSTWQRYDADGAMSNSSINVFHGEEDLIPDSIPDALWQSHFRQHDAELNDRRETEFLLFLYKQSSGRWPVIYDRWQMHPVYGLRGKSVESLKSKFNKVLMKLFEIDLLQQKRPATTVERIQISQQLKYLPIFAVKYNEKNEFLRRLFLENSFKRAPQDMDKLVNEMLRIPTMNMKKKTNLGKLPSVPGPMLASSFVPVVQTDLSASEYTRVKAVLTSLGIDRAEAVRTPRLATLFAAIEKEAATLLMMRDSLQRKKQELEILRSSGGVGALGVRTRPLAPTASLPLQSISNSQHKRKR